MYGKRETRLLSPVLVSALAVGLGRSGAGVAAHEGYLPRLTLDRLQRLLQAEGFTCQQIGQPRQQPLVWLCTHDTANAQEHIQIQGRDASRLTFVNAAVMPAPGAAANPTSLFRLLAALPFRGRQAQQARTWVATTTARRARSRLRIDGVLLAFTRRQGASYLSLAPL